MFEIKFVVSVCLVDIYFLHKALIQRYKLKTDCMSFWPKLKESFLVEFTKQLQRKRWMLWKGKYFGAFYLKFISIHIHIQTEWNSFPIWLHQYRKYFPFPLQPPSHPPSIPTLPTQTLKGSVDIKSQAILNT